MLTDWSLDPLQLAPLAIAAVAYAVRARTLARRGTPVAGRRAASFALGLVLAFLALASPVHALGEERLFAAHMVQHILLVLVAAPLLAFSAPMATLLRGSPAVVRRASVRGWARLGLNWEKLRHLRHPATVSILHVGTLWFWHAAVPYNAAVEHHLLHVVEHVSFLLTGLLFWRVVIGARAADRVSNGLGVLLVFGMALQSVFLSALLTFARTPWYPAYETTTAPWGLDPLADQQLAGVVMWVPAGLVYLGAGLGLFVAWLRATERQEVAV